MSTPLVTVLIPAYNGGAYLDQAIASVRAQTFADWRLLVIDDVSQDDTAARAGRSGDARVSVARNARNLGLYGTLAAQTPRVVSPWIVILMQDDRLKAAHLDAMLTAAAVAPDAAGIWATEDQIDAEGRCTQAGRDTGRLEHIESGVASWRSVLERGCIWTISGSMTRAATFRDFPLRADLPHCSDYDWFLRVIRQRPFLYLERALAEIRIHGGQASARHLSEARDLRETHAILRHAFAAHGSDLGAGDRWAIARSRIRSAASRLPGSLGRGQFRLAGALAAYVARFAALGMRAAGHR